MSNEKEQSMNTDQITLWNIQNYALAQIFDFVKGKLLEQNRQALGTDGTCFYRGDGGRKCAIGHLIPDEKYTPEMEYNGIGDIIRLRGLCNIDETRLTLLRLLRDLHDENLPEEWPECFDNLERLGVRDGELENPFSKNWRK